MEAFAPLRRRPRRLRRRRRRHPARRAAAHRRRRRRRRRGDRLPPSPQRGAARRAPAAAARHERRLQLRHAPPARAALRRHAVRREGAAPRRRRRRPPRAVDDRTCSSTSTCSRSPRDRGHRLAEVPTIWVDQDGSRVSAVKDTRRMGAGLLRLWAAPPAPHARGRPRRAGAAAAHAHPLAAAAAPRRPDRGWVAMTTPDVCLISPYPPRGERHGGHSGVASYTANLAHALADEGARVAVVAPRVDGEPERTRDGAVAVYRRFAMGGPGALPAAALAAAQTGAPVVHLQHETFLYGGPASVAGLAPALAALRAAPRDGRDDAPRRRSARPSTPTSSRLHRVSAPVPVARAGMAAVRGSIGGSPTASSSTSPGFAGVVDGSRVVPHGVEPGGSRPPRRPRRRLACAPRPRRRPPRRALLRLPGARTRGWRRVLEAGRLAAGVGARGDRRRRAPADGRPRRLRRRAARGPRRPRDLHRPRRRRRRRRLLRAPPTSPRSPTRSRSSSSGALALALAHRTPILVSPQLAGSAGVPDALVAPTDPVPRSRARLRDLARDGVARDALRDVAQRAPRRPHVAGRRPYPSRPLRGGGPCRARSSPAPSGSVTRATTPCWRPSPAPWTAGS